jgi:hypothetical protein
VLSGGFKVAPKIHADLMFVTEESFQHLVSGHTDTPEWRPFELASELKDLLIKIFNFFVVLGTFSFDIEPKIIDLVDFSMDLTTELFESFVIQTVEIWKFHQTLTKDLLLFGGLAGSLFG